MLTRVDVLWSTLRKYPHIKTDDYLDMQVTFIGGKLHLKSHTLINLNGLRRTLAYIGSEI